MRPIAMPATGLRIGTPASIRASDEPHTEAIDDEPLDSRMSDTTRIVYGKSSVLGTTASSAAVARPAASGVGVGLGIALVLFPAGLLHPLVPPPALQLVPPLGPRFGCSAVARADLARELVVDDGRLADQLLLARDPGQLA